jgi:hypothetical protein
MSQSAMSIPLIAFMTMPRRPNWRVRVNIFCHSASISSGSSPISIGSKTFAMTSRVTPPPTPASPIPMIRSSVSISTRRPPRRACMPPALP